MKPYNGCAHNLTMGRSATAPLTTWGRHRGSHCGGRQVQPARHRGAQSVGVYRASTHSFLGMALTQFPNILGLTQTLTWTTKPT